MPPQATGFRYTPPSYLLRTRDENRPWSSDNNSDGGVPGEASFENEIESSEMRQEDRPARKESSIDAHFQNRVNRRKQAYRAIIQGQVDVGPDEKPVDEEDVDLHLLKDAENPASIAAREARQRRLNASSTTAIVKTGETILSRQQAEATRARNLRAQRLRGSLKANSEEEEAMEVLRARRQKQAERDRLLQEQEKKAKALEEEQRLEAERQRRALEEERRKLVEERRAFEAAKKLAAIELERRQEWERKQMERLREEKARSESMSAASSEEEKPRRKSRRSEEEPPMMDVTLFEEFQEMMRDTGMLKCFVTSCFGDEEGLRNATMDDLNATMDEINDLAMNNSTCSQSNRKFQRNDEF